MENHPKKRRRLSLDAMRGLILVLMAVDHASFFIAKTHSHEFWGSALPRYESALPFLLRAATHLCAPGFFLLMGVGMTLFIGARLGEGWTRRRVARFFVTRGLLLIAVQQVLENPAWYLGVMGTAHGAFTFRGGPIPGGGGSVEISLGVLYGLGSSMVIWGLLFQLPSWAVAALSLSAMGFTQVAIAEFADPQALYSPFIRMLLIPGHSGAWMVYYPTIPWMGMTGLGMVLGRLIRSPTAWASRGLWLTGAGALLLFVIVRTAGGFGNLHGTAPGWIGFFNPIKYPPSLSFLLLTGGIDLLLLQAWMWLEPRRPSWEKILSVYGRSPLFFYISHLYLYALMGWAFPNGLELVRMLPLWLTGLLLLYPLCLTYGRFKHSRPIHSLWRLF
jgi:uncharacterized membrane protein